MEWESAEHVPVTLIAVIKAMADGKDPRQVIREMGSRRKSRVGSRSGTPKTRSHKAKKPMRTPKIIPPLSSKSYSVLHQIERVYEETRAPVPRVAIAAKHSPTGDNVGGGYPACRKARLSVNQTAADTSPRGNGHEKARCYLRGGIVVVDTRAMKTGEDSAA